jgi:rhamnulokinase
VTDEVCVAFDLGAESGRMMLGRFDGERVELREVRRFPTPSVRLPDGLYWDALGLHGQIVSALAGVQSSGARVRSIGIDSWAVDFGLIDASGGLIANPLSHRDGRAAGMIDEALRRVPAAEIYAVTGIQLLPINTLFQLLALVPTGRLEHAETLLLIPDLLAYWLTGKRRAEATNASTTQLLDVLRGDWALDLIDRLGLPGRIFPAVVEPGSVLGGLLPHAAEASGLPRETPVVSVASHDTASAVVAAPLESPATAYISSGTWSLVGVESPRPVLTAQAQAANLTNERGFGGSIRLLKNVMGLWLLQECRRAWLRTGGAPGHAELVRMAAAAPGGVLFDPDLPELLAPGDMPARIRAACERTGRALPEDPAAIARAIFESLACRYRQVLDEIAEVTGEPIERVHVVGGGSKNPFLCRLTADVTRRLVLAGPAEAAALGNVLVQLHAFGEVGPVAEMRAIVRRSTAIAVYEPEADGERWELLYEQFQTVVRSEVGAG